MSFADILWGFAAITTFVCFLFLIAMIVAKMFFENLEDESSDQDEQ